MVEEGSVEVELQVVLDGIHDGERYVERVRAVVVGEVVGPSDPFVGEHGDE